MIDWEFPEKIGSWIFAPYRHKVCYGGRDSAKSWSFARALLLHAAESPLRIGCFREVQRSIKESVKQLLQDQIRNLGLASEFDIQRDEIRGRNGSHFLFAGLSAQTRESIKSYEGLDRAWVEEADQTSQRSYQLLTPTIRKPGSELWFTFNPQMDSDFIYQRYVVEPPPDAMVVLMNYVDNPWRSVALDAEREEMRQKDPESYAHIYLGATRPAVQGSIYYKEVSALKASGRHARVPYDPMLKVHVVVDLGYNDFMSLIFVQRLMSEIRVIRYIEDRQKTIPYYSQEMRKLEYNFGKLWLPHDGFATTLASSSNTLGATVDEQFRNLNWDTERVPNIEVDQGIRKTREVFPRVAIDKENATELLNRLGRYRRRVDKSGQAHSPMHDDQSHGSDGFRYCCIVADQFSNDAGASKSYPATFPSEF